MQTEGHSGSNYRILSQKPRDTRPYRRPQMARLLMGVDETLPHSPIPAGILPQNMDSPLRSHLKNSSFHRNKQEVPSQIRFETVPFALHRAIKMADRQHHCLLPAVPEEMA